MHNPYHVFVLICTKYGSVSMKARIFIFCSDRLVSRGAGSPLNLPVDLRLWSLWDGVVYRGRVINGSRPREKDQVDVHQGFLLKCTQSGFEVQTNNNESVSRDLRRQRRIKQTHSVILVSVADPLTSPLPPALQTYLRRARLYWNSALRVIDLPQGENLSR